MPIAASVTAMGRLMIQKTQEMVLEAFPGSIVVYGDTDSVMCILNLGEENRYNMQMHFEVAEKLAAEISKAFPHPVELEFEKVRHLLLALFYKHCIASRQTLLVHCSATIRTFCIARSGMPASCTQIQMCTIR